MLWNSGSIKEETDLIGKNLTVSEPLGQGIPRPEKSPMPCMANGPARFFCMLKMTFDNCHETHYNSLMIKTFADKETERLYIKGKSRRLPSELVKRATRRLEYINLATTLKDLSVPPSNRLHALKGDREGRFSISINEKWRVCFRFIDGDAYDVEITDYH